MEKPKLDEKEKKYFRKIFQEIAPAQNLLNQAQSNLAQKNAALEGFMQYMKSKYNLPDGAQITPEGEIVLPE